jgi:hypothetical protein
MTRRNSVLAPFRLGVAADVLASSAPPKKLGETLGRLLV